MISDTLSKEAEAVLKEIIENESVPDYWKYRFENLNKRDDAILRGCFKELREKDMISVGWADNYPYQINILKDGYLYEQHIKEVEAQTKVLPVTQFEKELHALLERTANIKSPINVAPIGTNINEYNRPSEEWVNDVEIFYNKYLKKHSLSQRIRTILFHRNLDAYSQLISCLKSISNDRDFIEQMDDTASTSTFKQSPLDHLEYDVFLSHANADKTEIVEELNTSLEKLGINIFYDRKALEWGDKWKDRILEGTQKAQFAIIVISENFFGREWTEIELNEFLNRQDKNGQKLILPIIHNITNKDLRNKYPLVADIQAIDSKEYSCDEIALLFAKQLIKRLKNRT